MNTTAHKTALALFLGVDQESISELDYGSFGLPLFEVNGEEYSVGTDSECDEAAQAAIADLIWAFKASFILSECGLPQELEEAIVAFQEKRCEDANDALSELVAKCSSLESFTQSAVSEDGRGHFLSPYDGDENDQDVYGVTFYIYRQN